MHKCIYGSLFLSHFFTIKFKSWSVIQMHWSENVLQLPFKCCQKYEIIIKIIEWRVNLKW